MEKEKLCESINKTAQLPKNTSETPAYKPASDYSLKKTEKMPNPNSSANDGGKSGE